VKVGGKDTWTLPPSNRPILRLPRPSPPNLDRQNPGADRLGKHRQPGRDGRPGQRLTNKYAEGYPAKRYYGGCEFVDMAENPWPSTALKKLFGAAYANVQPHSGSQANMAVYFALLQPGDTVLGMDLAHGGHLTHGSPVIFPAGCSISFTTACAEETGTIDYEAQVAQLAAEHRPKMIVAGASAYPRIIDFEALRPDRRFRGALSDGRHGPHRRLGGRRPAPLAGAPLPMWSPPPPTKPCGAPRRSDSGPGRPRRPLEQANFSRESRAAR
jgi:hypothetical protein